MRVLVLNSGSSSLKFRLLEVASDAPQALRTILGGMIERIGGKG